MICFYTDKMFVLSPKSNPFIPKFWGPNLKIIIDYKYLDILKTQNFEI